MPPDDLTVNRSRRRLRSFAPAIGRRADNCNVERRKGPPCANGALFSF